MCGGASDQQKQLDQEQSDFYQEAMNQQTQVYGEDQQILNFMSNLYEPILAKGPNQQGFSQEENNALNTQATEGVAQNYKAASTAANEQAAALGGGDSYLPSGVTASMNAGIDEAAAGQRSSEQSQITQANYTQGYNQWLAAAEGLSGVSSQLSPTGYSGAATGAGTAASNTAAQIAQENNSWMNAALGAVGGIGSAVVNENPANIFG